MKAFRGTISFSTPANQPAGLTLARTAQIPLGRFSKVSCEVHLLIALRDGKYEGQVIGVLGDGGMQGRNYFKAGVAGVNRADPALVEL